MTRRSVAVLGKSQASLLLFLHHCSYGCWSWIEAVMEQSRLHDCFPSRFFTRPISYLHLRVPLARIVLRIFERISLFIMISEGKGKRLILRCFFCNCCWVFPVQCMCRTKELILLRSVSTGCLQYCLFVQKNSSNMQLQREGRKKGFLFFSKLMAVHRFKQYFFTPNIFRKWQTVY